MTGTRAVQNFRGYRGVWWGPDNHHAETLRPPLARLGLGCALFDEIGAAGLNPERDVLFVDADALFDPARAAHSGHFLSLIPVVGVVGVEAPSRLKALSDIGATALLHKPIHPATVYSSLFLAVNNHARLARLEAQVLEQNRRRSGRRYVVGAVISLMRERGMTDEQAYAHLRRESMARRVGVEDFARTLCLATAARMPDQPPTEQETSHATEDQISGQRSPDGAHLAGTGCESRRRSNQDRRARGSL